MVADLREPRRWIRTVSMPRSILDEGVFDFEGVGGEEGGDGGEVTGGIGGGRGGADEVRCDG
jgi:hypothetical protein